MIKTKINAAFPHHNVDLFGQEVFIVDYTEQTKNLPIKKNVEIHLEKPSDIDSFNLKNDSLIQIGTVIFDNCSFVDENGKTQTQCECVAFPNNTESKSWVLFIELKYNEYKNAIKNLNKARTQLFATYSYFKKEEIIGNNQTSYLIVSLPKQNNAPFEAFITTPSDLQKWKREMNIIFKGVNEAAIIDNEKILL